MMKDYTPLVEVASIDEAYLDVTQSLLLFKSALHIAQSIKDRVRENERLTCTIGVAPNKLLAKLGSRLQKPDGLVIIEKDKVEEILRDLPVSSLHGIGPKLEEALKTIGISTCGQLGKVHVSFLKKRFGVIGERLHEMGLGLDDSPVVPFDEEEDGTGRFSRASRRWTVLMGLALLAVATVWLAGLANLGDKLTLPARHWNPDNLARVQSVSKNPLSFAVFGDSRNGPRVFGRLLAQASRDPDLSFAVHLGDLVPDGQVKHYALFLRQVRQHLKMPLLTVAGNHEYDKNGRGLYREIFGPPNYAFSLHHAYFIMLDNAARAVLDPEQLSWLEKELKKAQGYKHRLVFLHVPLFDSRVGEKPHALPEAAGRQLLALFQVYRALTSSRLCVSAPSFSQYSFLSLVP